MEIGRRSIGVRSPVAVEIEGPRAVGYFARSGSWLRFCHTILQYAILQHGASLFEVQEP